MTIKELQKELIDFVREHFDVLIVMTTCALSLVCLHYYVVGGWVSRDLHKVFENVEFLSELRLSLRLIDLIGWSVGCVCVYLIIPMLVLLLRGKRLTDYGWNVHGLLGHLPIYLMMYIAVAVAIIYVSFRKDFQNYYPFYHDPESWRELLIWEVCYAIQFVSLEFFFRGFMVHGLKTKLGNMGAVCVMVFPYLMIHFGKPWLESVGAFIAGAVLGTVSLRTRSIAGGVVVHVMVAWSMDAAALWQQGWFATMSR